MSDKVYRDLLKDLIDFFNVQKEGLQWEGWQIKKLGTIEEYLHKKVRESLRNEREIVEKDY